MIKLATTVTEVAMISYWAVAASLALNVVSIDPALMYPDHENPVIVAWNWSFFPIDLAFAILGLSATYGRVTANLKLKLRMIAATLMMCAGLMAVSFWAIVGDFSPIWWLMNIWLIVLGAVNLYRAELGPGLPRTVQARRKR